MLNEYLLERLDEVGDKIVRKYGGRNLEELDTERVNGFLGGYGLKTKDVVVLNRSQAPAVKKLLASVLPLDYIEDPLEDQLGVYWGELDMYFVYRDSVFEALNGPFLTESFLVHEAAHSTERLPMTLRIIDDKVILPRSGFLVKTSNFFWGRFLEEGFAEFLRGEYVARYYPDNWKERVKRKYLNQDFTPNWSINYKANEGAVSIPLKYCYFSDDNDSIGFFSSSLAGYGLERVMDLYVARGGRREAFIKRLVGSRTDINDIRQIIKIINSINPGLYSLLARGAEDQPLDFLDKFKYLFSIELPR